MDNTTSSLFITTSKQSLHGSNADGMQVFNIIVRISIGGVVSVLGVMANIVNIVVFYRQGPMSSSPTVILTSLAVSDLTICVLGVFAAGFTIIETFVGDFYFGWYVQNLRVILTSRPLNLMTQVTCWFTSFMSFERAVSVTFPFKVKTMFTPRRSLAILLGICVFFLAIHVPNLTELKRFWHTSHALNFSFWRLIPSNIFPDVTEEVYFIISPVILRFASVLFVVLCNVIIFWKVQSSKRFRQSKSSTAASHKQDTTAHVGGTRDTSSKGHNHNDNPSSKDIKDIKLLRMITTLAAVFVVCYSVNILHIIVMNFIYETGVTIHLYKSEIFYLTSMVLQYFNSCINLVIYYTMSARFKEELHALCGIK